MEEKAAPQKTGFWSTLPTVFKAVRSLAFTVFFVVMLVGAAGLVLSGGPSLDLSPAPNGWHQVHKQTQFSTERAFNPAVSDTERQTAAHNGQALPPEKVVAAIRFNGDVEASGRDAVARQVDEILVNKELVREVVVVVNSPGGTVNGYGQIFAELQRLRQAGIPLTVCIDQMAASGGYLMSLPANKIIAAPLAMVGSVGTVMEFLNFADLLKSLGIQPVTVTAGKFKRTVTQTAPVTPEGLAKLQEDANKADALFLGLVKQYRPHADLDKISSADHWLAQQSVDENLGLVDQIGTSADYLLGLRKTSDIVFLSESPRSARSPFAGLTGLIEHAEDHFIDHLLSKLSQPALR